LIERWLRCSQVFGCGRFDGALVAPFPAAGGKWLRNCPAFVGSSRELQVGM
jgi:hypothetical protein